MYLQRKASITTTIIASPIRSQRRFPTISPNPAITRFGQWSVDAANGRLAAAKKYYGFDQPGDIGIGESATYYEQLRQMMRGRGYRSDGRGLWFGPDAYARTPSQY